MGGGPRAHTHRPGFGSQTHTPGAYGRTPCGCARTHARARAGIHIVEAGAGHTGAGRQGGDKSAKTCACAHRAHTGVHTHTDVHTGCTRPCAHEHKHRDGRGARGQGQPADHQNVVYAGGPYMAPGGCQGPACARGVCTGAPVPAHPGLAARTPQGVGAYLEYPSAQSEKSEESLIIKIVKTMLTLDLFVQQGGPPVIPFHLGSKQGPGWRAQL